MRRHALLEHLHARLQPRSYLEIGVSRGFSMSLSRTRSIGIDPFYRLTSEQQCDLHLVRITSDEFFAREHPLAHFDEPVVDLAFIDGMHLAEYALRDLMNVEQHTHAASVVVLDDMLPRTVEQAARVQPPGFWTGDVYKVPDTLRRLRPDLVCLEVDTTPTGVVVVLNPDPTSSVLLDAVDDLVEDYVTPDPQPVPQEVLDRTRAVSPRELLALPVWDALRDLRDAEPDVARRGVAEALAASGLV